MRFEMELKASRIVRTLIEVRPGCLAPGSTYLTDELSARSQRVHVVVDRGVLDARPGVREHLEDVSRRLPGSSFLVVAGGERTKSFNALKRLVEWLDARQVARRSEAVVGIGGGAVLDTVSLAASLYRRGVTFWRLPTTVLAAIDAGIGAKSAINFFGRKNLLGTYQLPERVLIDPLAFDSISERQLRSGLAEAFKLGLAVDETLFTFLMTHASDLAYAPVSGMRMGELVTRCIAAMTEQLADDLFEASLVHPTDLGHSFSRRIEEEIRPRLLHGEAVALDIALSAACSEALNLCDRNGHSEILAGLRDLGLPTTHPALDLGFVRAAYQDAVVHRDGDVFPLPAVPGQVALVPLDDEGLRRGFELHLAASDREAQLTTESSA